jgi:hypothetical protein
MTSWKWSWGIVLVPGFLLVFLPVSPFFAGEIYRWTDQQGTVHFTDDSSKIPEDYSNRTEKIDAPEAPTPEVQDTEVPPSHEDRVKKYLQEIDQKIAMKRKLEKRASELEEGLRLAEERVREIEAYEREYYYYFIPFRDPKTGNFVPVGSPYYDEKVKLERRIKAIKEELISLREAISKIQRSL